MNILLWVSYIMLGIVIFAPLIQGDLFNVDKKYFHFKYVSIVLALWWLIDFSRHIILNGEVLYNITLMIFPVVFLLVFLLYIAIKNHSNSKINKVFLGFGLLFLIIDVIMAFTNTSHRLFLNVGISPDFTFEQSLTVESGTFFLVHTFVSYTYLIIIIFYIMKNITSRARKNNDIYPFVFIITSIVLGFVVNIIHIFINTFRIDPTLITVAVVLSVLYYIFYIRDLKLLLGFNRNRFIIDNLREQYVIVDEMGTVIDASNEFKQSFNITFDTPMKYNDLVEMMKQTAVLFEDSDSVLQSYDKTKSYLNTQKKDIYLPFYKRSGSFYLFYDQTADLKYIYDMNHIKTHDLMTNIYNRNFLEDIRDNLDDNETDYQLILFDLDGLKLFNDYLGHNQGDDLLIRFANQLKEVTKDNNLFPIRLGGDEFLILAVAKTDQFIQDMVDKMKALNEPLPFLEKIQYSYAISKRCKEQKNMKSCLAYADREMYKMKAGKSNYKELLEKELKKLTKK